MKGNRYELVAGVLARHRISLAYLFGSQAQAGKALLAGEPFEIGDSLSDLDLGVVFDDPLPSGRDRVRLYASLYNDLIDLFSPLHLDLVLLQETHSVFQLEAMRGTCVYESDEQTRDNYEMNILRRAADFRPVLAKFLEESLEEV